MIQKKPYFDKLSNASAYVYECYASLDGVFKNVVMFWKDIDGLCYCFSSNVPIYPHKDTKPIFEEAVDCIVFADLMEKVILSGALDVKSYIRNTSRETVTTFAIKDEKADHSYMVTDMLHKIVDNDYIQDDRDIQVSNTLRRILNDLPNYPKPRKRRF